MAVNTGVPAVIVNPFARLTTSVPVVTVTVCEPTVALGAILITAVVLVDELTVKDETVIPVPKEAIVVP